MGDTIHDNLPLGAVDRTIALDENGGVHICWTGTSYYPRVQYNYSSSGGGFSWPHGVLVSSLTQSLHPTIGLIDNRRAAISSQVLYQGDFYASVSVDQGAAVGIFEDFLIPSLPGEVLSFPRFAVDQRNWFHIIAYTERDTVNLKKALYYNRSEDSGFSWVGWTFVDSVRVLSATFAASWTGKVALAWSRPINPELVNPLEVVNNDIYFVESEDGQTWDFTDAANLTDFIGGIHPESDTLRAYQSISLIYNNIGHLHFAYTCTGYFQWMGHTFTTPGSKIFHYSDITGFNYIAGELSTGATQVEGRRLFDLPSLGYYAEEQELYCIWNQFSDSCDTSSAGYPNGEIWGVYSEDCGWNWSQTTNLTNTHSPGALPGESQSEDHPAVAAVVNDTIHLAYLLDREPGPYWGTYTSDIIYQKISTSDFKSSAGVESQIEQPVPRSSALMVNYPNPFNPATVISFNLPTAGAISLIVYDLQGREVAKLVDGWLSAGEHERIWNGEGLRSGVYFGALKTPTESRSKKLLLLK